MRVRGAPSASGEGRDGAGLEQVQPRARPRQLEVDGHAEVALQADGERGGLARLLLGRARERGAAGRGRRPRGCRPARGSSSGASRPGAARAGRGRGARARRRRASRCRRRCSRRGRRLALTTTSSRRGGHGVRAEDDARRRPRGRAPARARRAGRRARRGRARGGTRARARPAPRRGSVLDRPQHRVDARDAQVGLVLAREGGRLAVLVHRGGAHGDGRVGAAGRARRGARRPRPPPRPSPPRPPAMTKPGGTGWLGGQAAEVGGLAAHAGGVVGVGIAQPQDLGGREGVRAPGAGRRGRGGDEAEGGMLGAHDRQVRCEAPRRRRQRYGSPSSTRSIRASSSRRTQTQVACGPP